MDQQTYALTRTGSIVAGALVSRRGKGYVQIPTP